MKSKVPIWKCNRSLWVLFTSIGEASNGINEGKCSFWNRAEAEEEEEEKNKKVPLSLEELLAKKKAEEEALSKVWTF